MHVGEVGDDEERNWWNICGWGNTQDGIEGEEGPDFKPSHVATGRWYDIKLTVSGRTIKCWLDGQLIHDFYFDDGGKINALYATAATDAPTGDLIVKVVNTQTVPLETELNFAGATLTGKGTATVLTSKDAKDENSLAEPTKVYRFPTNQFQALPHGFAQLRSTPPSRQGVGEAIRPLGWD